MRVSLARRWSQDKVAEIRPPSRRTLCWLWLSESRGQTGPCTASKPPSSWFHPASRGTSVCFPSAKIADTGSGRKYPSISGSKCGDSLVSSFIDCVKNLLGWNRAQFLERFGAQRRSGKLGIFFERGLAIGSKGRAAAGKCRAAFADRFMEQTLGERRCHERAHGERPCALAKDGDVAGSPPKAAILRCTHSSAAT